MSSGLCEEEHQLEAVHLHDIWTLELGRMPSAMHSSFYLPHMYGLTGWRKTDMVVAVALSCLTHPFHVQAASPAPGHALIPTYKKQIPQTVGSDHCEGFPDTHPFWRVNGGLGGIIARGGATVAASM